MEKEAFKDYLEGKFSIGEFLLLALRSIFSPVEMILMHLSGPAGFFLRQVYYKKKLKHLGKKTLIDTGVIIRGAENISIGDYNWIDTNAKLQAFFGEIKIGNRCHISHNCLLLGNGGIYIEDYVGLGPNVTLLSATDMYGEGKRMSGAMLPEKYRNVVAKPIVLKKDSFVGVGAIILPGVTLGEGAVVGSGSLVTHNVKDYDIVMGIPARKIGHREKVTCPDI